MTKVVKFGFLTAFYALFAMLVVYGLARHGFIGWFLVILGAASITILVAWKTLRNIFHGIIGIIAAIAGLVLRSIDLWVLGAILAYKVSLWILRLLLEPVMPGITFMFAHPMHWAWHSPWGTVSIFAALVILAVILSARKIAKVSIPSFIDEIKKEWKTIFPSATPATPTTTAP